MRSDRAVSKPRSLKSDHVVFCQLKILSVTQETCLVCWLHDYEKLTENCLLNNCIVRGWRCGSVVESLLRYRESWVWICSTNTTNNAHSGKAGGLEKSNNPNLKINLIYREMQILWVIEKGEAHTGGDIQEDIDEAIFDLNWVLWGQFVRAFHS
jgi:hypothetical protein